MNSATLVTAMPLASNADGYLQWASSFVFLMTPGKECSLRYTPFILILSLYINKLMNNINICIFNFNPSTRMDYHHFHV